MNNIDKFFSRSSEIFSKKYFEYLGSVLNNIDTGEIKQFIQTLLDARERNASIFFIGNGGSAATASHFANDLAIGTNQFSKPFKVFSLANNLPIITAVGNDFGYDSIFLKQLEVYAQSGDIVVGISASGNSQNLISAFEYANELGVKTIAITAFDGGQLKEMANENIHVPTGIGEYGPAEDAHMILDHLIGSYLMRYLKHE
jgi:D-sedoheptulose 7-phosphate isomerase